MVPLQFSIVGAQSFIWVIFFALVIFFAVWSAVMIYHWFMYGVRRALATPIIALYLSVAGVLIATMALSAIAFTP